MQIRVARGRGRDFRGGACICLRGVLRGNRSRHGFDGHSRLRVHHRRSSDIEWPGILFLIDLGSGEFRRGAMAHFRGGGCGTEMKLRFGNRRSLRPTRQYSAADYQFSAELPARPVGSTFAAGASLELVPTRLSGEGGRRPHLYGEWFCGVALGARFDFVPWQGNGRQILGRIGPGEFDAYRREIGWIAGEEMPYRQQDDGDGGDVPQRGGGESAPGKLALNPFDSQIGIRGHSASCGARSPLK